MNMMGNNILKRLSGLYIELTDNTKILAILRILQIG